MTLPLQSVPLQPRLRGLALPVMLLLAACAVRPLAAPADPPKPATTSAATIEAEIPKSVFVVPRTAQEGKDPFFPKSTRLVVVATNQTPVKAVTVGDLVLKILSGTPAAPLATINNRTFGVGEEAEVITPNGKALVRCLEIRLNDEVVVIEVGGERRELRFPRRK